MKTRLILTITIISVILNACGRDNPALSKLLRVRQLVDTIGFAHYPWQMETLFKRYGDAGWKKSENATPWRFAICPHDDYTYTGTIYPDLLQNVKAKNLLLIGVAHRAAQLGISDSLVFDSYDRWKGPWKDVEISPARDELFNLLKKRCAITSDTLQKIEHSVEAMIPFLQYFNRNVCVIPVLVPAMSPDRMKECGMQLSEALKKVVEKHHWRWGKDFAIIVTTDAVHYGNEDWGGADRALFGCDSAGNAKALDLEHEIISKCLTGDVTPEKIRLFSSYTLDPENYRNYKWTWCGRYSVPVALYAAYYLNGSIPLRGKLVDYGTSITRFHIPVDDIKMGRTAIATPCHWVGYAAISYN